ncbi:MAG: SpoIIE family protein phosphatase [Lachnospiraceae bacterium]|nr:SpoIIE family protein phosphatase [Lachnospiraceae bacterium]
MEKGKKTELLPAYGQRRIMAIADAYRELAYSYGKETTEGPVDRREAFFHKGMAENRSIMAENLREMADSMCMVAKENLTYQEPSPKSKKALAQGLKKHGIILDNLFFMEKDGSFQMVLNMKAGRDADYSTEDIAEVLSGFFRRPLISSRENMFFVSYDYDMYVFESKAPYRLLAGQACATKAGEKTSGDSSFIYEVSGREKVCAISDGAGSGEEAFADSELALEWLEKYLDSGFSLEHGAELVNHYFLSLKREQNMPTLDACSINLEKGSLRFAKYGASPSYIKRDGYVEKIPGYGFPLGFASGKKEPETCCYLEEGDCLIMMSDGVLECFREEALLVEAIGQAGRRSPSEAAFYLLQKAIYACGGHIRDDMTILFATLEAN